MRSSFELVRRRSGHCPIPAGTTIGSGLNRATGTDEDVVDYLSGGRAALDDEAERDN